MWSFGVCPAGPAVKQTVELSVNLDVITHEVIVIHWDGYRMDPLATSQTTGNSIACPTAYSSLITTKISELRIADLLRIESTDSPHKGQ